MDVETPADTNLTQSTPFHEAFTEEGIDLTLVLWMQGLSPTELLQAAQDMIDTAWLLRESPTT